MADNNELAVVLRLVADQFKTELQSSRGAIGAFNDFLKDWKTQLAAAGTALFAVAKSTADFGEEALKTSQRLGTTVEITTALQYAAHMADVPIGTLEKGLKTLAQAAVQASSGSGDGAKLFTQLGLSATDATGKMKPLDQLFLAQLGPPPATRATGSPMRPPAARVWMRSACPTAPSPRSTSASPRTAIRSASSTWT